MQDCHAVFQPSYARLIRFRDFWALSSAALHAAPPSDRAMRTVATSAVPVVHPLSKVVVDNTIDGGVREGRVPCDGTGTKIVARLAGAPRVVGTKRPLSTGGLRKAAEMISSPYIRVDR